MNRGFVAKEVYPHGLSRDEVARPVNTPSALSIGVSFPVPSL